MEVTELGIVNEVRLSQQENAERPMDETESGIVNEVRREYRNAPSSMEVTELGML